MIAQNKILYSCEDYANDHYNALPYHIEVDVKLEMEVCTCRGRRIESKIVSRACNKEELTYQ